MPITSPVTRAGLRTRGPGEIRVNASCHEADGAPRFVLLEARGPHPAALALSSGLLSTLVAIMVALARTHAVTLPLPAEVTAMVILRPRLSLPSTSPPRDSPERATRPSHHADAPEPLAPSDPPAPVVLSKSSPDVDADAPVSPPLQALPLPDTVGALRLLAALSAAPAAASPATRDVPRPTSSTLGSVSLPGLIAHQESLASSLAALSSDQRRALPRVSIRVDAEWLRALPQTQEKLYFSLNTPQAETLVLAYLPATRDFAWEWPLRPLWQIRDAGQVPQLAALRDNAARRLGVPAELVSLYTWHPSVFENALLMFVRERMQTMGMQLGPRDLVTVRLTSGSGGWLMNLEPIADGGNR